MALTRIARVRSLVVWVAAGSGGVNAEGFGMGAEGAGMGSGEGSGVGSWI